MTHGTVLDQRGIRVQDLHIGVRGAAAALPIVRGVSFEVSVGQTLALVGESGTGKSLTARSLLGVLPSSAFVSAGSIVVNGVDIVRADERTLRRMRGGVIGFVPQDPMSSLNPVRRVGRIFREVLLRHTAGPDRRGESQHVDRTLAAVGLQRSVLDRYPHQLSGGMKQRVLIALALVTGPSVIIADEPTTALDATVQAEILDLLTRHVAQSVALILITHDLGVAATVCSQIAIMYAGQIVERGPIGLILGQPKHPYTQGLLAAAPDFDRSRECLVPIRGAPPTPGAVPHGCAFAPRCDFSTDNCLRQPFLEGEQQQVACWHPRNSATS
jgi:oligopeptide/dipeptide ABC transporter ATP-binding protein